MDRRSFLGRSALALAGVMSGVAARQAEDRSIAFVSTHTGERIRATYWLHGQYLPDALQDIDRVLRDHRTGDVHPIDPRLLDLLHRVGKEVGTTQPYHLISGYRSPATNAMLRGESHGVASKSLHLKGWAADVRLPGVELGDLRDAARALRTGGVGYYPGQFVHVDIGRVRYW